MPLTIPLPFQNQEIPIQPLSQKAFAQFGTVIENPSPSLTPHPHLKSVLANQGSALKYLDVTHIRNLYGAENPGKAVMNMFVCAPRTLIPFSKDVKRGGGECFEVEILERHPFTTQTFIPLGLAGREGERTRYLVIVASSLEASDKDEGLPVPASTNGEFGRYPGRGLPDLKGVKAFLASGSQAVTYGAGTWHAPMVVIGERPIDFVVVQFANGVATEDCQEVNFKKENGGGGLLVTIPGPKAKL